MKLALTGATGFVGAALLDLALAEGHEVRALTRRPQADRAGVAWIAGDLADGAALADLVQGADAVIHVAGVVNASDRAGFEAGNVAGTQAMLDAAETGGVSRFVHVSSLAAREPGLSAYGASKLRAEERVQGSGLDWTMVRPPMIYGPRDKELLDLFRSAKWGLVPVPAAGRASIIHVEDLARLLLALATASSVGTIYEADDGVRGGWRHRDMARAIAAAVGRKALVIGVSARMLEWAAKADGLLRGSRARLTPDRAAYFAHPDWTCAASAGVPKALWSPRIETRAGLAATARWYRKAGWL
ncbi:NAD-dependent epimerase/dehydratase family protein [Novosphingobium aquimarinum]|uniref:NAD-dependent epimerase/dehydratase family protein n=1 Tax=Novosphingobium aquimarinum TaxID=2682494 RepID=UPI0012EC5F91|nr:NAD-dependent epimerase/dehydratase family protein [Novosphingobium aquimarinum]